MEADLERAFEFMRRADMAGTSVRHTAFGLAVSCEEIPLRQDSNYLLVRSTDASAPDLAREAEQLGLRTVLVRGQETATRLDEEFTALGWKRQLGVVMVRRRPPEAEADPSLVTEVDAETLAPLRRAFTLSQPWGTPELADQLTRAKTLIAQRVETHFLAVLVHGRVAACADLYLGDGVGQIEDVLTVEEHRNRGYASALVLYATHEAARAGAVLFFLVADADDWPRRLYGRLGFDVAGGYAKFFT